MSDSDSHTQGAAPCDRPGPATSHQRNALLGRILDEGLVAVIRAPSADLAEGMAQACLDGGLRVMEVALTTPGGLRLIERLQRTLGPHGALIGAGTVLDETTARLAVDAGARYLVTPALDDAVVRLGNRYQLPVLPGAMTVREVIAALEAGADIVKLFPGETLGPTHLRALMGPLPHAPLMPTGGVSAANAAQWFEAGAVALGVGGSLTAPGLQGDWTELRQRAEDLVAAVCRARGGQRT
jgi:2-dehydro-3-deoxyphosphogluconate aldolase/(4S)-4-hydroxy-2-oxoglutarate aldolase